MTLTTKIFIALIAGSLCGILLSQIGYDDTLIDKWLVSGFFTIVGKIFISFLKMLVVPVVFVSLVCGVSALKDITILGRVGIKALILYLFTTALAISIALILALIIMPGEGANFIAEKEFSSLESPPLSEVLVNIVPSNPFSAFSEGNMLQIIVFSLLFGVAINLAGVQASKIKSAMNQLNEIVMKMVSVVMLIAPYGVFCLIAKTFATQGIDAILALGGYFFTVIAALIIHASFTYTSLVVFFANLNPIIFFKKMRNAILFAFSTASSAATIPITLNSVKTKLGVDNSVASFTVPLGATINMDGTAIMLGVATVFIANTYGIDLGLFDFLTVILIATIASIGTAGVPGVGLIMLAMVLRQVGLPVEGIAIIIGIDRLLDMLRTAVNITGDASVSCVVAKSENKISKNVFENQNSEVDKVRD